ncbi:MAG: response regulator transcription factor, partial [Actinobacteria bacterium]|nr:response regulator transcription factor [Actinomycetota bacterium]
MSGQRVLVVDDEPQILRALGTTLRGAGYAVDTAATASAALAAAAASPPEAVILDLVLPDGNGTEVTRELRTWSQSPVIVLSAVGEEKAKIAALDAGADDYVTKPFSVDELLARLRAVMRRQAVSPEPVIEIGDLRIDVPERTVAV